MDGKQLLRPFLGTRWTVAWEELGFHGGSIDHSRSSLKTAVADDSPVWIEFGLHRPVDRRVPTRPKGLSLEVEAMQTGQRISVSAANAAGEGRRSLELEIPAPMAS